MALQMMRTTSLPSGVEMRVYRFFMRNPSATSQQWNLTRRLTVVANLQNTLFLFICCVSIRHEVQSSGIDTIRKNRIDVFFLRCTFTIPWLGQKTNHPWFLNLLVKSKTDAHWFMTFSRPVRFETRCGCRRSKFSFCDLFDFSSIFVFLFFGIFLCFFDLRLPQVGVNAHLQHIVAADHRRRQLQVGWLSTFGCHTSGNFEKNWINAKSTKVWLWPCGARQLGTKAPSPMKLGILHPRKKER